jgi:hypothetical protein
MDRSRRALHRKWCSDRRPAVPARRRQPTHEHEMDTHVKYAMPTMDRIGILIPLVACALPLAIVPDASARPRQPVLIQVTHNTTGNVQEPKLRTEKGNSIVFVSDGDVLGGPAPGHREVYFYDVDAGTLARVTHTTGGESYGAARETDSKHNRRPTYVAFTSTGDLDPRVGNADGNPEIFAWIRETGEIVQLTDTPASVVNGDPYASDGGKCITFRSSGDLQNNDGADANEPTAGFTNADGSDEVFRMSFPEDDFVTRRITQVSSGPAGTHSEKPVVGGFWFTRQCRSTVYQSDYDQLGNGSTGIHIYNWTKTNAVLEQLSEPGHSFSTNPAISGASSFARGPFVLFESDMDPIRNDNQGREIFRFRLFKNELLQYSYAPGDSIEPSVSDGGGWGAFASTSELVDPNRRIYAGGRAPFNADGNLEIFRYEQKRKISQITSSENCENTNPTVKDNARAIAFRSTCDLIPGGNPNHVPQVFLYVNVKPQDPLMLASVCKVDEGCCNEATGCYREIRGSKIRPPKTGVRPDFGILTP